MRVIPVSAWLCQRFTTGNLRRTSQEEGRRESLDTSYIDRWGRGLEAGQPSVGE